MWRYGGIALALLLGGCASTPVAAPPPPQPDADPPYRRIIAENLEVIFSKDAQMRGVSLSGVRKLNTPAGPEWRVCLRGTANSATGVPSVHTYAIFIRRDTITDRRLARPTDACDQERYEPLARA